MSNMTLYKVTFPEFWERACREKNAFFQKIEQYARRHVQATGRGSEYLEGENIRHFWHEHCEFCWEKPLTHQSCEFYCTKDMYHWICPVCFRDFCEQFHWNVASTDELFAEVSPDQPKLRAFFDNARLL